MAYIKPPFTKKVLHITKRKRKSNPQHYCKPDDFRAIAEIVKRDLGPEIYSFCRCMKGDIDASVDTGVKGLIMEVPASTHLIEHAYKWPLEKAVELSIEATSYAHEQGLEVVFFPIDFSRSEIGWVLDLIDQVATEGHMDALALVDTFGVVSPHAMKFFVREVKKRFPDTRLETHFHQDFGVGVANTLLKLCTPRYLASASVPAMHRPKTR